jgi:tetratricopeptide (TPR) repeat protein
MKKIITFFLLILCNIHSAQELKVDSLTTLINNTNLPLEKAKLLIKRSKAYSSIEIQKPKNDALEALQLAKKANDTKLQIEILNQLSGIFSREDNYAEALKLDEQALTLSNTTNDAVGKVRSYKNMGRNLKTMGKIKEAIQKTSLAKQIAIQENIPQELATINNALGILYRVDGQFNASLEVLNEALSQVDKNKKIEALIYMNKGNTLSELVRLEEAATSYFSGLKISESINDLRSMTQFYNNLSTLFKKSKQYEKAISYSKKSLAISESYNTKYAMGIGYDNIATLYDLTHKNDSVIWYRKKAIVLFETIKDQNNIARCYHNLGHYYLLQNKFKEAQKYLSIALSKRLLLKNKFDIGATQTSLAIVADKEHRYDEAEKLLFAAQKNLKNKKTDNKKFFLNALAEHYKLKGDIKNALQQKEAAMALQDSLLQNSEIIKVMETAHKYELEKKEIQLQSAKSFNKKYNKNRFIFTISLIFVFIIALYSFIRWKNEDRKKKALLKEKQLIEKKHDAINEALKEVEKKVIIDHIALKNKTKIYLNDLLYIHSEDHYLELVTLSKKELIRASIKTILEQLPPNFIRCHKSYVVNKNFIKQNTSKEYILSNGAIIPKSRTYIN